LAENRLDRGKDRIFGENLIFLQNPTFRQINFWSKIEFCFLVEILSKKIPNGQKFYYNFNPDSEQRALTITIGSTPNNVGPGKYNVNEAKKDGPSKSTAPFGATSERDNVLISQTISPGV